MKRSKDGSSMPAKGSKGVDKRSRAGGFRHHWEGYSFRGRSAGGRSASSNLSAGAPARWVSSTGRRAQSPGPADPCLHFLHVQRHEGGARAAGQEGVPRAAAAVLGAVRHVHRSRPALGHHRGAEGRREGAAHLSRGNPPCRPYFIGLLGERYGWIPESIPQEIIAREPWLKEHVGGRASVTELEVLHGVLNNPDMQHHAFFYFRDPGYVDVPYGEGPGRVCRGRPGKRSKTEGP